MEVQKLDAMLGVDELQHLSQKDIHRDMNSSTFDEFSMDVFRETQSQHLVFFDPESRQPFRNSLNPILNWLDWIQKREHAEIAQSNARRCAPEQSNAALGSAPPKGSSSYLVFVDKEHIWSGGTERSCIVVYPDGGYRAEKTAGVHMARLVTKAAEGQLSKGQTSELQDLLDSDPLKNLHHNFALGGTFQEIEKVRLAIPRAGDTQVLTFGTYTGLPGARPGQITTSGVMNYPDQDERVIERLQKWLKTNIEKNRLYAVSDGTATNCLPSR
jgi:hypothetical protein